MRAPWINGNNTEVAQTFLDSQAYKDKQRAKPGFKMSLKTVETPPPTTKNS